MSAPFDLPFWRERVEDLCDRLRDATRRTLEEARSPAGRDALARPVSRGAGDVTFGLDLPSEVVCTEWLHEVAREAPLSLLTEDAGWRHRGPRGELTTFDHGGPRIAIDPIDGTRNLMADLRPAWTLAAVAAPGPELPWLRDVVLGFASELPNLGAGRWRRVRAEKGAGCELLTGRCGDSAIVSRDPLHVDDDTRCDHGYFPFFRYERTQARALAAIEAEFHERLAENEDADTRSLYDDQYISNGGQLVLLTLGTYRFVADLRAWLAERTGIQTTTSKPYDSAGAVLCAREAGAVVEDTAGAELDYPLDATTPVSFVGFVNRGTRERLRPHLDAALNAGSD